MAKKDFSEWFSKKSVISLPSKDNERLELALKEDQINSNRQILQESMRKKV